MNVLRTTVLTYGVYVIAILCVCSLIVTTVFVQFAFAQTTTTSSFIATTTVNLSICGDTVVDVGEECDVLGETGGYSTTIIGRQCNVDCQFGPYCGDGTLQTIFSEECDDGNNTDSDFCSALCKIEPAGGGGGGTSGGGGGSSGGSSEDLGDTQISVTGKSIPSQTVHVLLDGKEVGTVRADSAGRFDFATNASPGTVSLGFWTTDTTGTRTITYTTTFDVTQGAITNVNSILVPPSIRVSDNSVNPGEQITFSGQSIPNAAIEVHIDNSTQILRTVAAPNGVWSINFNTAGLSNAEHTARARFVTTGTGGVSSQSSFSTTLQLFIGVAGAPARPSDLSRDGKVNLTDFSILIFWWGSAGGNSEPPADISSNGRVGLEDFSILLFNWTG